MQLPPGTLPPQGMGLPPDVGMLQTAPGVPPMAITQVGMPPINGGGGETGPSESFGPSKLYGALLDEELAHQTRERKLARHRRRVNCFPMLMALMVPWGLYLFVYGVSAFHCRFYLPLTTLIFIVLLWIGVTFNLWKILGSQEMPEELFYPKYFAVSCFVAVTVGFLFGSLNFWEFMHPAYEVLHLATYSNVNPSSETLWSGETVPTRGSRFQDAGTVYFGHDAVLDSSKAMSFKMGDTYCVAPIVNSGCERNCGYDFWAVGVNCCSEDAADFRCGEYKNKKAKSGLRMMIESRRPLFRLAVMQAEGVHQVRSNHPLFFYWMQDPPAEIRSWQRRGYKRFLVTMFMSFIVNAVTLGLYVKGARVLFRR